MTSRHPTKKKKERKKETKKTLTQQASTISFIMRVNRIVSSQGTKNPMVLFYSHSHFLIYIKPIKLHVNHLRKKIYLFFYCSFLFFFVFFFCSRKLENITHLPLKYIWITVLSRGVHLNIYCTCLSTFLM